MGTLEERIGDRLVALKFPYFYEPSSAAAATGGGTSFWRQLRDALVFAEDAHICLLPEVDAFGGGDGRASLKVPSPVTRELFVAKALLPYVAALRCVVGAAVFPQVHSVCVTHCTDFLEKNIGKPTKTGAGGPDEQRLLTATLTVVVAVLDVAVLCATSYGAADEHVAEGSSAKSNAEIVLASHRSWTGDLGSTKRLVTWLEPLPPEAVATEPVKQPKKKKKNSTDVAEDYAKENARKGKVHESCERILAAVSIPCPSDPEHAVQLTLSVVNAVELVTRDEEQKKSQQEQQPKKSSSGSTSTPSSSSSLKTDYASLLAYLPAVDGKRDVKVHGLQKRDTAKETPAEAEVQKAIRVMRMLFTTNLALLQRQMNKSIAELQNYTAQCKTDASLGVVGS